MNKLCTLITEYLYLIVFRYVMEIVTELISPGYKKDIGLLEAL